MQFARYFTNAKSLCDIKCPTSKLTHSLKTKLVWKLILKAKERALNSVKYRNFDFNRSSRFKVPLTRQRQISVRLRVIILNSRQIYFSYQIGLPRWVYFINCIFIWAGSFRRVSSTPFYSNICLLLKPYFLNLFLSPRFGLLCQGYFYLQQSYL